MYQEKTRVLWNRSMGNAYYRIGLTCHKGYAAAAPGQFVMLQVAEGMTPLLRRPFSIHNLISGAGDPEGIELLYKVIGEGTRKLFLCKKGDVLDMLGPLGTGFTVSDRFARVYLAAGGIGVAPMLFLAQYLKRAGTDLSLVRLFLGGRSKSDLLCKDAFLDLGVSVHTTTDDGTEGDQCFVTHPLEAALKESPPDILYGCGPREMLKCIIDIAESVEVPCEVSIEATMACGMGACLGCAVEKRASSGRYLHACMDGPVFDTRLLKL